jgi:sugar phosphate isomerase/epimerase
MDEIGVMLNNLERDRLKAFAVAARAGFRCVHTSAIPEAWLNGPERQEYVAAARDNGVSINTMFAGFDGQSYADRSAIARTVGLVIPAYREHRRGVVKQYSELARELGVKSLAAHIGFIPPDLGRLRYGPLVEVMQDLLDYCARNGQTFHVETGQEAADVLLQFLRDVDRPNLGVNFDPANFILYGTDDPLQALDLLAPYVRGVHCKDAVPAEEPDSLGTEVPIGQGAVNFPRLLARLKAIGYRGPLVIEREHGPTVLQDVLAARDSLRQILSGLP